MYSCRKNTLYVVPKLSLLFRRRKNINIKDCPILKKNSKSALELMNIIKECHLFIYKFSPKSGTSFSKRILWQERIITIFPILINVFKNHERLANGFSGMNEDRDFFVNRVEFKKQRALVDRADQLLRIHIQFPSI